MKDDFAIDVEDFLACLGVRNINRQGDEVVFSCPFDGHRNGDSTPSAAMNVRTTSFNCKGCHRKGNAISFLVEQQGVTPMRARNWLRTAYSTGFKEPFGGSFLAELEDWLQGKPKQEKKVEPSNALPETTLERFRQTRRNPAWDYMQGRGFTTKTLVDYEIGYDDSSHRVTIPVRDCGLMGFKGRAIGQDQQPRYILLGDSERHPEKPKRYGFPTYETGAVLWGADSARCEYSHGRRLLLCEGELNALALRQFGWNAVAISGSMLDQRQVATVLEIADRVTLFWDSDEAGVHGMKRAYHMLVERIPVTIVEPHEEDPAELLRTGRVQEIARLASHAKPPYLMDINPFNTIFDKETRAWAQDSQAFAR